jgi:hypothetical protein
MKLALAKIHAAALDRPPGYYEAVTARGTIDGDYLEITSEALAELRAIYRPTEPALPSAGSIALNAARAAAAEIRARTAGTPSLPDEEIVRRLDVCKSCDNWRTSDSRCAMCGCYMAYKTRLRSSSCPIAKW